MEKHVDRLRDGEMHFSNKTSAIDRLIDDANFSPQPLSVMHNSSLDQPRNGASASVGFSPKPIQSFVKAPKELVKTGNSIRDHPSTWNYDSDQLANELAAFALEISEAENSIKGGQQQRKAPARRSPEIADTDIEVDDIYVYETYLRVHRSELVPNYDENKDSIGVLVIEEQDQELWQTFAEDEEDSGWDEEDGDSNGRSICLTDIRLLTLPAEDNPRNDYPEDEVSSEDEYGHGAYKYRNGASDDEEYGLEDGLAGEDEDEDEGL